MTQASFDPTIARRTWRTAEAYHGIIYFAPEAHAEYKTLGLRRMSGYFASRSAAMGAVTADVVIATFFNFHPQLVRDAMSGVWDSVSPAEVHAARVRGADGVLRRLLTGGVDSADIGEAAELARAAAMVAIAHLEGRPLFAAHSALPWPDEPHLVLWHAQMLLREFRGDGHIAALTVEGLSGLDALILHAASGQVSRPVLQTSRQWSDKEWANGISALNQRGLVDSAGGFTDVGRALRERIEDRTDSLAAAPYEALGEQRCARLRALVRPFSQQIVAGGGFA